MYVGLVVEATDWLVLSRLTHVILPKFFNRTLADLFYLKEIQYLTLHYPHLLSTEVIATSADTFSYILPFVMLWKRWYDKSHTLL